jgi:hypothetical protein
MKVIQKQEKGSESSDYEDEKFEDENGYRDEPEVMG